MSRSSSLLPIQYALITMLTDDDCPLYAHTGARVYDFVPENPTFPYIQMASPTEAPMDVFNKMGERSTFRLHIWSTYRGSKETKEIIQHVNDILDRGALSITGYTNIWCYNTFSTDMRDPDGIHWHGIMDFTILTLQT